MVFDFIDKNRCTVIRRGIATLNMRKNKNRPLSSRITGSNVLWSLLDKGSMAKHETLTGRYQAETNFLNKMFKKTINYYQ